MTINTAKMHNLSMIDNFNDTYTFGTTTQM
jgi:hypothetical protein